MDNGPNQTRITQFWDLKNGVQLSEEQQYIRRRVVDEQKSAFITGPAGCGKSHLLKVIVDGLQLKHNQPGNVVVCAPTGSAAINCNGVTIHRYAGFTEKGPHTVACAKLKLTKDKQLKQTWQKLKVLVIDEVSMVSDLVLEQLEAMAQITHDKSRCFGGVQVVAFGDFMQLPPINARYAFQSFLWVSIFPLQMSLTKIYRQQNVSFVRALNEIRSGLVSQQTINLLQNLNRPLKLHPNNIATKLFSTNASVERENTMQLAKLPGNVKTFEGSIKSKDYDPNSMREYMIKSCQADYYLKLKLQAKVMLVVNQKNTGLVNGSIGHVVDITPLGPVVQFRDNVDPTNAFDILLEQHEFHCYNGDGTVRATLTQYPLRLAWAISIHKSQGSSLEFVEIDCTKLRDEAMFYVALSRGRSIAGLRLLNFRPFDNIRTNQRALQFMKAVPTVEELINQ